MRVGRDGSPDLRQGSLGQYHLACRAERSRLKAVEIDTAGRICCVPGYLVHPRLLRLVRERCNFSTENVIDLQEDISRMRNREPDRRTRVERVRIILLQGEPSWNIAQFLHVGSQRGIEAKLFHLHLCQGRRKEHLVPVPSVLTDVTPVLRRYNRVAGVTIVRQEVHLQGASIIEGYGYNAAQPVQRTIGGVPRRKADQSGLVVLLDRRNAAAEVEMAFRARAARIAYGM